MPFLCQSNFPRLWLLFQYVVGATSQKRRLATICYKQQKKALEIGCSVGHVSQIFAQYKHIEFTGIDIDNKALAYAVSRLGALPNFTFSNISLAEMAANGKKFDYVLFANILHHVDDKVAHQLLKDVQHLLSTGATLIIMEPEKKSDDYSLIFSLYYRLEMGKFRRHKNELVQLIESAGLPIKSCSDVDISPDMLPFLRVGTVTFIEIVWP